MPTGQWKNFALVAALGLLAAAGAEGWLIRPRARDAEPFHARVRQAVAEIPRKIGNWEGPRDEEVPPAAVRLLRPNALLQRTYWNPRTGISATLLIVQCGDAADMGGHYPPVCYPSNGYDFDPQRGIIPGDWKALEQGVPGAEDGVLRGTEYAFRRRYGDGPSRNFVVRNLIVLPQGKFARDIREVRAAAADYQRQFYGAAQIQVLFDADRTTPAERDIAFAELLGANRPLFDALTSGGSR